MTDSNDLFKTQCCFEMHKCSAPAFKAICIGESEEIHNNASKLCTH